MSKIKIDKVNLYDIILAPITTEKTQLAASKYRQYAFKVSKDANKIAIKKAVSEIFKVAVARVSTLMTKGKSRRFKNKLGQRSNWKKAVITLAEGEDINFAEFE